MAPVPNRCAGEYTAARVFVDLETEEELVVRGLYYDDANDDIVLYLHLVNILTAGKIDKGVMNPRETVDCNICMFKQRQSAKCSGLWIGRVFKTTLGGAG